MFDSVSRKDYDAERDARVRAEALAEQYREQVQALTNLLKDERERHAEQMKDLLDRFSPKAGTEQAPGVPPAPFPLSSQAIRSIPAIGRRGVAEREMRARIAEEREQAEERRGAQELTPAQEQLIDERIAS